MKQIIDAIAADDSAVPAISNYWQDQMAASGEPEEGIRAFLEKREPDFRWNGGSRPEDPHRSHIPTD
jgi:enoyl-CoA hydratase/carnithine racemase